MERYKQRTYEIVADPPEGDKLGNNVNIFILILIALNVLIGILETVTAIRHISPAFFYYFELFSVLIFTVEYLLRLWSCTSQAEYRRPFRGRLKLALTPMALVDIFAILPFFLQFIFPGLDLRFIRALRLLRLFRLFRMGKLAEAFRTLGRVVSGKKEELMISLVILVVVLIISSSLMFLIEGSNEKTLFTSVPASMWWGMMTITTIGYGDMYPLTTLGRILGAIVGFCGICIFALPVGILGAGFVEEVEKKNATTDAKNQPFAFCPHCGERLPEPTDPSHPSQSPTPKSPQQSEEECSSE